MNEMLDAVRATRHVRDARFGAIAQALHWLTALLVFTTLPIAWIMQSMAHGSHRDFYVNLHKSIGMTLLLLVLVRLAWRSTHPAPCEPAGMGRITAFVARISHWALYALVLAMPVSGYLSSATGGHAIPFFGLFQFPDLPPDKPLAHTAAVAHQLLRWPLYALILGHVAATAWHVAWRRDGVLERMLPEQKV